MLNQVGFGDNLFSIFQHVQANYFQNCEEFDVILGVEKFRHYWKPEKPKVVLLAESHVYTTIEEFNLQPIYPEQLGLENYPQNFTRFVYCLAYGENELMNGGINNPGTWQFWKIFYSCLNFVEDNEDFGLILMGGEPDQIQRLKNKVKLLKDLQEAGIWLIDASLFALYKPGGHHPPVDRMGLIKYCWDQYILSEINYANPNHIICIGKGVANILAERLLINFQDRYSIIPQPNAHLPANEHLNNFQKYFEIVQENI